MNTISRNVFNLHRPSQYFFLLADGTGQHALSSHRRKNLLFVCLFCFLLFLSVATHTTVPWWTSKLRRLQKTSKRKSENFRLHFCRYKKKCYFHFPLLLRNNAVILRLTVGNTLQSEQLQIKIRNAKFQGNLLKPKKFRQMFFDACHA